MIQGRVQGVGFRAFVRRLAEDLEVGGEVWNRRDGAVEGVAFGSDPALLTDFCDRLRNGPGRVESVEVWDEPDPRNPMTFEIGPTR